MWKSVYKGHNFNFKSSEFKNVVNNKKYVSHPIKNLTSKKQIIYTQNSNKTSFSCYDDKRYLIDDGTKYFSIWS